jgi:hypothetical protein
MNTAAIKAEVLRDFKNFPPAKQVSFGNQVLAGMGAHPLVFSAPKILLTDLALINSTLNTKNLAAATGDKEAIRDRDNYLPVWIDAYDQQADYVQLTANGNTTIIEQSGYHSTKTNSSRSIAPDKLMMDAGPNRQHGSIWYKSAPAGNHSSYLLIGVKDNNLPGGLQMIVEDGVIKLNANGIEFFIKPSTTREGHLHGLTPRGAEIKVTALAFNPAGISPLSEPVSVIVP